MENFPYIPLDVHNHEIRIFVLEGEAPFELNGELSLSGRLEHVSLIDMYGYMALSYCWGDPNPADWITLKPYKGTTYQRMLITQNLKLALKALWSRRGNNVKSLQIWVDAICINQGDTYERSQQVQMMRQIYSKADKVLAWVGPMPGEALSPPIVEHLSKMLELHSLNNLNLDATSSSRSNLVRNGKTCSGALELALFTPEGELQRNALESFFDGEYWKRVWIIQEITVASSVRVLYGDLDFSWDDVADVLSTLVNSPAQVADRRELAASHLLKFREHFYDGNKPISLFQAMAWTLHTKATDPRDKIFALLGLCHDGFRLVQVPNYKQSLESIISEMSRLSMSLYRSLDLMCLKGTGTKLNSSIQLPTWAPNWPNLWSGGRTIYEMFILENQKSYKNDPILSSSTRSNIVVEAVYIGRVLGITSGVRAATHHTQSRTVPRPWIFSTSDLRREIPELGNGSQIQLKQRRTVMILLADLKYRLKLADVEACFESLWTAGGGGSIYSTQIIDWIDNNAWFQIGPWTLREWSQLQEPEAIEPRSSKPKSRGKSIMPDKVVKRHDELWGILNLILEDTLGSGLRLAEVDYSDGAAYLKQIGAALVHPHVEVSDELFILRGCSRTVALRRTGQSATSYAFIATALVDSSALGLDRYYGWAKGIHDDTDPGDVRVLNVV
jgi:hypothetical protein